MTISYFPSRNRILLQVKKVKGKPTLKKGPFELWTDEEGNINGFAILAYTEISRGFVKKLKSVQLGGLWKGVEIRDEDIQEARAELLKKLEEKY